MSQGVEGDRGPAAGARAEALVVVDVQRAFVSGDGAVVGAATLLTRIEDLVRRARTAGALLVHLKNDGPVGAVDEPGKWGGELHLPVIPGPREFVVRKTTDDGFHRTALAALLTTARVRTLVVCGVQSEMCVAATARTALARDFRTLLPHDAHATYDIPPAPGISAGVPAAMVSRVAEWALGDEVVVLPRARDVTFVEPAGTAAMDPPAGG